jgi:hypothetical protein
VVPAVYMLIAADHSKQKASDEEALGDLPEEPSHA